MSVLGSQIYCHTPNALTAMYELAVDIANVPINVVAGIQPYMGISIRRARS